MSKFKYEDAFETYNHLDLKATTNIKQTRVIRPNVVLKLRNCNHVLRCRAVDDPRIIALFDIFSSELGLNQNGVNRL